MRRRWLQLALLAGVVAGLLLVVWQQPGGPGGDPRLTGLEPESIERIRVQRPNREDLTMRRQGRDWQIESPARAVASAFHVRQVLELARARSRGQYAAGELDAAAAGLDPPRLRLELDDSVLEFGATDPVDGLRFIAVDGVIHLVQEGVSPLLEGGWWNFIDRHLAPGTWEIETVETDAYELVREGGVWRDRSGNLSREQVASLMADLRLVSALVVREGRREPDADAALTIRFTNGEVRRFRAVDQNGERRLHELESGLAYVLDGAVREYLLTGRGQSPAADGGQQVHEE